MKKLIKLSLLTITLVLIVVSCAYHKPQERSIATQSTQSKHQCMDSVKGEYQSYFDSVETCIEKDSNK